MRYFEDFNVGDRASFGSYAVTREEVLEFARKYDAQPFHLSDEAAAATHFGRLAASGWHSCAMTMAMFVAWLEHDPQASLGAAGIDELRWLKPVYPGDTLRVETEVLEARPSKTKPIGIVRTQMRTFNQNDELVLSFIPTVLIGRRPA
jgi:acyl dehydratase